MIRGFRDFFVRGNVIQLSTAVVLGLAFSALITTVVNNWIGPLLAAIGGRNPDGLAVTLVEGNRGSVVDFGAILTAVAGFLLIATIVYYLVVLPVRERELRRRLAAKFMPPEPTELDLLAEIRGLLTRQQQPSPATPDRPNGRMADGRRVTIEVTQEFSSRMVALRANAPGLVIDYGGYELAFTVGRGPGALVNAHEFAVGLAYTALAYASRCRVDMGPRHAAAPAASG